MDLKYITLFAIVFLLAISSHNAFAVKSIYWTLGGSPLNSLPFPTAGVSSGNLFDSPFSVLVDATDESDYTTNDIVDTIDVSVSSIGYPVVTYTLVETGSNTGLFTGTNFVFLVDDSKFQSTDTVDVVIDSDSERGCYTDDTITKIDSTSGGSGDGVLVFSDTDLGGVGLVLTETGENTCKFIGKLKFTTSGSTDESTGTLKVSPGDILTVFDPIVFAYTNAQIVPTISGKGSIQTDPDDDQSTAEVSVTYNGLSAGLNILDEKPGSGTGGPIHRPGLVLDFLAALVAGGSNQPAPPTLGLDENQKRIVDDGFSFNDNPVNVEQFYTHYPLITTQVGQNNTVTLKIYEDKGPDNIAHVGLSYGLGKGDIFNEGRATIEYDKTFDGKESVTLFDPKHVLGWVNVTASPTSCSTHNNAKCLEVTFDHIFRAPLEYNMVATNIWDFDRNGWQNYFNHGIQIVGESMNPPEEYSGVYNGHTFRLIETGKNTAIDSDGHSWTFDKIWNRDYTKPVIVDSNILNQEKIGAIEQLGFQYLDGQEIFGFDRVDHRFTDIKNQQQAEAQNVMNSLCPECQMEPFEKINNTFSYEMPTRYSKLNNPQTISQMHLEDQKARHFLQEYFDKIYIGRIND